MNKSILLYFQLDLPLYLKNYRFFDIGNNHQYYNEHENKDFIKKMIKESILPLNNLLTELIYKNNGDFKCSFSINGETFEQLEKYASPIIDSFSSLNNTGHIEFLGTSYYPSLAFLKDKTEFNNQVNKHSKLIETLFEKKPKTFNFPGLIYSDSLGVQIKKLGYNSIITEGAKHILGWRSPNYLYHNMEDPSIKILLRNGTLSDDVALRFSNRSWSEWPLTADKFIDWIKKLNLSNKGAKTENSLINIFIDYTTFGIINTKSSGIFDFIKYLPEIAKKEDIKFTIPSEVVNKEISHEFFNVEHPISWAEEEKDLSIWLGNDLQEDAFNTLYSLNNKIHFIDDPLINSNWGYLQNYEYFRRMTTKKSIENSDPYENYINYMNILSDFTITVENKIENLFKDKKIEQEFKSYINHKI